MASYSQFHTAFSFEDDKSTQEDDSSIFSLHSGLSETKESIQAVAGQVESLTGAMREVVGELRQCTAEVCRLCLMTECRNTVYFLDQELVKRFGRQVAVRKQTATLLETAAQPGWVEFRTKAIDDIAPLAGEYWLASAGLAVAAWADDRRLEAEKRILESLLADKPAAALFFCLVSIRYGRYEAATAWCGEYYASVDPLAFDAEAAHLFLAVCDGLIGAPAQRRVFELATGWVAKEMASADLEQDGVAWQCFLRDGRVPADGDAYPLLREQCVQWNALAGELEWYGVQEGVLRLYQELAGDAEKPEGPSITAAMPMVHSGWEPAELLAKSIDRLGDDEREMRRERLLAGITIEENGDTQAADARMKREWPDKPGRRPFSEFLADIATGALPASPQTVRIARILALPWLERAHAELQKGLERSTAVEIRIGEWTGRTENGDNASDLRASYSRHCSEKAASRRQLQWLDEKLILPSALLIILTIVTLNTIIVPVLALGGFAYLFLHRVTAYEKEKEERQKHEDKARRDDMDVITAFLEEVKAFRKMTAGQDRKIKSARQAVRDMDSARLSMRSTVSSMPEKESGAGHGGLPEWSLVPPS